MSSAATAADGAILTTIGDPLLRFHRQVFQLVVSPLFGPNQQDLEPDPNFHQVLDDLIVSRGREAAVDIAYRVVQRFSMNVQREEFRTRINEENKPQCSEEEWDKINTRMMLVEFLFHIGTRPTGTSNDAAAAIIAFSQLYRGNISIDTETPISFIHKACKDETANINNMQDIASRVGCSNFFGTGNSAQPSSSAITTTCTCTCTKAVQSQHGPTNNNCKYDDPDMLNFMVTELRVPTKEINQIAERIKKRKYMYGEQATGKWKKILSYSFIALALTIIILALITIAGLLGASNNSVRTEATSFSLSSENTNTSHLIPYDTLAVSVSLIIHTLTGSNSQPISVNVYRSNTVPDQYYEFLSQMSPSAQSGNPDNLPNVARYNYNYYIGTNIPIFLLNGSSISYELLVTSDDDGECNDTSEATDSTCTSLYLFDNERNFDDFRNYQSNNALTKSDCFLAGGLDIETNWTFHINESALYYVVLQVECHHLVTGNVSVIRTPYNVTGLQSACQTPLSKMNNNCTVNLCNGGNFFGCKDTGYLLLTFPPGDVNLSYSYGRRMFSVDDKIVMVVIGGLLFIALIIVIRTLLVVCCIYIYRKRKSSKEEGIV